MPEGIIPATDVDGVIETLLALVEESAEAKNPNGLFYALYTQVTRAVQAGLQENRFDDSARMERLDVAFANILFQAVSRHRAGTSVTQSWGFFFGAASIRGLTAAQHMLLSVGPHILHDLALATAQVIPEDEIDGFQADFNRINDILEKVLDQTESILGTKSCGMRFVDWFLCRGDEWAAMSALKLCRDQAFDGARRLQKVAGAERAMVERDLDNMALDFCKLAAAPVTSCALCGVGVPEKEEFPSLMRAFVQMRVAT